MIAALVKMTQHKMGILRLDAARPLAENGGQKGRGDAADEPGVLGMGR